MAALHKLAAAVIWTAVFVPASAWAERVTVFDRAGKPVPNAVLSWSGESSSAPSVAIVDQIDKHFAPFVSAIRTGSSVRFPNSDDIRHHVYSFSDAKTFELKLYHSNDAEPVLFDKSGLVTLGCNVHDTMKAYIWVTDEPTAVSDKQGVVDIPDAIDEVRAWHPQLTTTDQGWIPINVQAGVITLPMEFDASDPQAPKDRQTLEQRMQRFKRHAN